MKNILKIFKRDVKGLCRNFFALVIALGLCLLPALYAWFNIYANWDPYANTGNIQIAVANLDNGITVDGSKANMGDNIVESLKEKDSIGWQFLDTREEAKAGVKSGKYYAAIVIDKDFSYEMYNGVASDVDNPKLTYYVNDKKNAVATKITDTAVSTLQASVNKEFVKTIIEKVFEESNLISEDMSQEDVVNRFVGKLEAVSESLDKYEEMISTFSDANSNLSEVTVDTGSQLEEAQDKIDEGIARLDQGQSDLDSTTKNFNSFSSQVNDTMAQIEASLASISSQLGSSGLADDAGVLQKDMEAIVKDAQDLSEKLNSLMEELQTLENNGADLSATEMVSAAIETIKSAISKAEAAMENIDVKEGTVKTIEALQSGLETMSKSVSDVNTMYQNQIVPQVNNLLDNMGDTLSSVQTILTNLKGTSGTMSEVFDGVGDTLGNLNMSLTELQTVIGNLKEKIDDTLERIDSADMNDKMDIIINLMAGNPQKLGEFFSEPVQMSDNYIYEIKNYGSGVAPFYSTLAIWVGMTILVSLVKVHTRTDDLVNPKPSELFFGRYLLFLLLSQIQALVIVLGDLFILKIQCVHPFAFWGVSAMASLTFSLLIYALTIAFGDIGKAAAVVIMVIQIAGSGGTYPIEALPSFFRAVYIFFPFPYAINAMRECVGGMYENNFSIYMAELGIFCLAALFIGLVVRIPFIKLNHFIEKRMEDTEML